MVPQEAARRSQSMNSAALHTALTQKLTKLQGLEITGGAIAGNGSGSTHGKHSEAKKKPSMAATEALNESFQNHVAAVPTTVGVPGAELPCPTHLCHPPPPPPPRGAQNDSQCCDGICSITYRSLPQWCPQML